MLIESVYLDDLREKIDGIRGSFSKKDLHCKNLTHFQKLHFCQNYAKMPVVSFGAISLKETLKWYKTLIKEDGKKYYNKCAQLLLECVGEYLRDNSISAQNVEIVFEKGNFAYEKMRNLIRKCQRTPLRERTKLLNHIDANNIDAISKSEESLLQLPDLVAHCLYKCIDRSNACFGITEPRYLLEIKETFYNCKVSGDIIGKGVKPIYSLSDLKLDEDIFVVLEAFKKVV